MEGELPFIVFFCVLIVYSAIVITAWARGGEAGGGMEVEGGAIDAWYGWELGSNIGFRRGTR